MAAIFILCLFAVATLVAGELKNGVWEKHPDCPPPESYDDESVAKHLPGPTCDTFYKCDPNQNAVLLNCPNGLEWNSLLEVCDWPQLAGCSSK